MSAIHEGSTVKHPVIEGVTGEVVRIFTVPGGDKELAEVEFPQGVQTWAVATLKNAKPWLSAEEHETLWGES